MLTQTDLDSRLCSACQQGNVQDMAHLIAAGADVNTTYRYEVKKDGAQRLTFMATPLMIACLNDRIACITMLLQSQNIHINQTTEFDRRTHNALTLACTFDKTAAAVELLKHPDIDVNHTTPQTALMLAVRKEQSDVVQALLRHSKLNFSETEPTNGTALHYACNLNNLAMVKLLLTHPAAKTTLAINNGNGFTPIELIERYLSHSEKRETARQILNLLQHKLKPSHMLKPSYMRHSIFTSIAVIDLGLGLAVVLTPNSVHMLLNQVCLNFPAALLCATLIAAALGAMIGYCINSIPQKPSVVASHSVK